MGVAEACRRFTAEQIVAKLREAEKLQAQGLTIPAVCKRLQVALPYTDQDRLLTATEKNSGGTVTNVRTYCYDKNGNRTVAATGTTTAYTCPGTPTSSWDGANQQLTGPDGAASLFTFDLDGDETSTATALPSASTTRQTTWTDSQQAAQLQIGSSYMETNTYIGAGNAQLTTTGTGPTSQDQTFNTITGIDSVARYTGSSLVSSFSAIRDPAGQLLALQDNSSNARYYPLYDNQGSVLRLVDASGNTVDSYSYDPYGTRTTSTNTYPQPFGYTGAYTNPTTGLVHLGARFYDPTLGRFTQPDPQTHPGDITQSSPYPYAGNDPINNTDPSGFGCGLSSFSDAGDCLGGAASGVKHFLGGTRKVVNKQLAELLVSRRPDIAWPTRLAKT